MNPVRKVSRTPVQTRTLLTVGNWLRWLRRPVLSTDKDKLHHRQKAELTRNRPVSDYGRVRVQRRAREDGDTGSGSGTDTDTDKDMGYISALQVSFQWLLAIANLAS